MKLYLGLMGICCSFLLLSTTSAVELEEFLLDIPHEPASSVWLEYRSGLEDSQDASVSVDQALNEKHRLLFGYGQSDLSSPTGRYDIYTVTAGYHSAYGRKFEFGVFYDFWGNTDDLWTHALSIPLVWNTPDWSFALTPKYTRIYLYRNIPFRDSRIKVDTDSQIVSLSVAYYGIKNWEFLVSGQRDWYEHDMTRLDRPIAEIYFSDLALALSYGFPKSRVSAQLAYNFPRLRLGLQQEQSVSAVDNSELNITTLKTSFYYFDAITWHLDGGYIRLNDGNNDSSNFIRLAMQWSY